MAQNTTATTESFMVEGSVKQSQTFSLQDLVGLPTLEIDSIVITNHLLERKSTLKNIKGVLLKDVLGKITIDQASPKLLSEYYIVCIAADNYKVVFSWNEIFNNETGRHVMIITEQGGKKVTSMENRIAVLSPTDEATGRRYVKGLQKIIIERVR
ncbi:MAG: molybdopterin-binding protein [Ferruginibacter sp.]|nr:molybdopterin-binding protein [Ferruginibacter sp.]